MATGRVVLRPEMPFNGVKVFSATMFAQRDCLGEQVTSWLSSHPQVVATEMVVTQSSDEEFHCVAITVFYWEVMDQSERE